jgi:hypothetical protein
LGQLQELKDLKDQQVLKAHKVP